LMGGCLVGGQPPHGCHLTDAQRQTKG
jgi:hypothetical protein